MRVKVYFNRTKGCFSVRATQGPQKGRVIAHTDYLLLEDVFFSVNKAANERVRETGRREAHAFVEGTIVHTTHREGNYAVYWNATEVKFYPFIYDTFVETGTEHPIYAADYAELRDRKIYVNNL